MAAIAPGKLHRLRNRSTAAGRFVILAADHQNSLRQALMPEAPDRMGARLPCAAGAYGGRGPARSR